MILHHSQLPLRFDDLNQVNLILGVRLDCNQYKLDMDRVSQGEEDVYDTFNILMRRKPKENNFKAVLETIRDLMNTDCVVPDWLHDIILGYGDPASAHYSRMPNKIATLDFYDTFLSFSHLKQSFPQCDIETTVQDESRLVPPFRLTFNNPQPEGKVQGGHL